MEIKPWELKTDNVRSINNTFVFHIFCEDRNSEPLYFEHFNGNGVKIICHREQRSMFKNYLKTIKKCKQEGFIKRNGDGSYKLVNDNLEVWCVFDRDLGAQGEDIEEGNIEFDHIINNSSIINIAWSNDAFEFWILLHLRDVSLNELEKYTNREQYYTLLEDYLKNHSNPNELLTKVLSHNSFNYDDIKKGRCFPNIMLPELIPNIDVAIKRAKKIFNYHSNETDFSKKVPCTTVYQLVESILDKKKSH